MPNFRLIYNYYDNISRYVTMNFATPWHDKTKQGRFFFKTSEKISFTKKNWIWIFTRNKKKKIIINEQKCRFRWSLGLCRISVSVLFCDFTNTNTNTNTILIHYSGVGALVLGRYRYGYTYVYNYCIGIGVVYILYVLQPNTCSAGLLHITCRYVVYYRCNRCHYIKVR